MSTDNQTHAGSARMLHTTIASPIGPLLLLGDRQALHGLYMQHGRKPVTPAANSQADPTAFAAVTTQLEEYFAGERRHFDLRLRMAGTPFQVLVWGALKGIPYGETISYGELARRIRRPSASRAVGLANGSNPISIIVPCHRVIGSDGTLTGYGGGIERKRLLLDLEGHGRARADARDLPAARRASARESALSEPIGSTPAQVARRPTTARPCTRHRV